MLTRRLALPLALVLLVPACDSQPFTAGTQAPVEDGGSDGPAADDVAADGSVARDGGITSTTTTEDGSVDASHEAEVEASTKDAATYNPCGPCGSTCNTPCPTTYTGVLCCAPGSVCYATTETTCNGAPPVDAGATCPTSCASDSDCQSSCPPVQGGGTNCCYLGPVSDGGSHTCYATPAPSCP
jgi:hypothetical protein